MRYTILLVPSLSETTSLGEHINLQVVLTSLKVRMGRRQLI